MTKRPTDSKPEPVTMSTAELQQTMASFRSFMDALERGQIVIEGDGRTVTTRKPTVRELRAQAGRVADGPSSGLPVGIMVEEPKRQRKQRQMAPRKVYSLKAITTRAQMQAIQQQTPAASAIAVYLATHPKASVPELATQLDLKRKTIENLLSVLRGLNLVEAHDR